MTVCIDHDAYPHIIDLVLKYAPTTSLVILRGTSSAFRDRVDATLFRHVALRAKGSGDKLGLHFVVPPGMLDSGTRLPLVPSRVEILDSPPFELPAKPSGARTHAVRRILRQLTSLHTVRRFTLFHQIPSFCRGGPHYTHIGTLVDFIDQIRYTGPPLDRYNWVRIGPRVQRYVLHIRKCVQHHRGIAPTHTKSLREIVIAVQPCCDGSPRLPVWSIFSILLLVHNLLLMGRHITLTFVGVPPPVISGPLPRGLNRLTPQPDHLHALSEDELDLIQEQHHPEALRQLLIPANGWTETRYLSFKEWWDELGDGWEVEGVWPASGPDARVAPLGTWEPEECGCSMCTRSVERVS